MMFDSNTRLPLLPRFVRRARWHGLAVWLLFLVLLASAASSAAAEEATTNSDGDPTAITLSYFRVIGLSTSIRIEWGTETEFETAGFFVRRATEPAGDFQDPGIGFVPAQGGELAGTDYSVIDDSVTVGQTYWYVLIEVETSGAENEFGPFPATAGATPTATAVPLASPGASTSTPPPTGTGLPTSTAAATSAAGTGTPTPTPTVTRTTTPTPPPSATPTRTPISVSGNPTATPFVFPTATPASGNSGVVEAAEDLATTPIGTLSAYPGPGAGYPGPQPLEQGPEQSAYPSPETAATAPPFPSQPSLTAYPADGSNSDSLPPVASTEAEAASHEAGSGRLLLWVGFAVALVVFVAGVYSAILFFNRRPTGSR